MTYYLNNNFRGENNFKFKGYKVLKTIVSNITAADREDIIYLLAKEKLNTFEEVKIYIFRGDTLKVECIYKKTIESANPKIKLLSFQGKNENTIVYSYNTNNTINEKGVYIIFTGGRFETIEKITSYI